jgi:hypothetical protein
MQQSSGFPMPAISPQTEKYTMPSENEKYLGDAFFAVTFSRLLDARKNDPQLTPFVLPTLTLSGTSRQLF